MPDQNEIALYGTVGDSFWGEQWFTASGVRDQLATMTGDVTVRINSGGGIATEGQAIYNLLKDHDGAVNVIVDGIAASAASLIAMAGTTITMRDGALLMIHDPAAPFTEGRGTEADHLRAARQLGVMSNAYAAVYARRAGLTVQEAREIMRAETYMEGAEAVSMGFATGVDEEQAQAFAAFDYAAYAHAPKELLDAGAGLARRASSRRALVALMAGTSAAPKPKGHMMADENETDDDVMTEAEETLAGGDDEEVIAEGDAPEGDEPETEEDDTPDAATARAVAVLNLCNAVGMSTAQATTLVSSRMSLEEVAAHLAREKAKGNPMTGKLRPGAPVARILRDERDTRRTGMEGAIVARMSRARDVSGPARDFMGMTLAEMAHASTGQSGRPTRGAGELRAIEMAFASHSTSDLPAVLENAMNKRLAAAHQAYQSTYRAIAERIDFTDFRAHPISNIGNWPTLLPVGESGEIKYGTVGDKGETVALVAYARAFSISRQMLINDDLGAIERALSTRGMAVAAFEDQTFFAMLLSGANSDGPTLTETARQVFNTTDATKASANAAITPASIALGYAAMSARKSVGKAEDQVFIRTEPRVLLTGPAKQFEAAQLLAPIQSAQASNVNPYVGKLEPVMAPHIPGNAWYLFADPAAAPCFMYGYLSGEAGPRMRMDEPFGQQGLSYSVELDFGCGATDFRGGYKNAGA